MRLLSFRDNGDLTLTNFVGDDIPHYAVLSHTWGPDGEEVTFKDIWACTAGSKAGYTKVKFCGENAAKDALEYFWVDTCCIDKSSSTELQEAIASMFRWYRNATKCYVYLSDVSTNSDALADPSLRSWQSALRESRWFTRGWTLQELIAPLSVEFFCSNGRRLGDKVSLERQLHEITGIAIPALRGTSPSVFSVTERMSWSKNRQTKREEDKAYSLLGIFDVHMPLLYGEGEQNAFERLSAAICEHAKKHKRDEVSQAFLNHTKRLKSSSGQPSSIPSLLDLHPEPLSYSGYAVQDIGATTYLPLIDKLYFNKIDQRLTSLTAAQGKTCRWFLTKPEYISWHDVAQQPDHGGFLWIKGNPGTGKSTLMKFLFEEAKLNAKSNSLQVTVSFFFLARGTVEEKSTMGLYRSLLHQLFEKAVELKESLEWMTADGARGIQQNGWNEQALKQTLVRAIKLLGARSLMIFVDALDECDTKQTMGMVCFFEELCDHAKESQVRLQICFSSRHYPTIVVQKGIEVNLEDEIGHTEDIEQYIKSNLRLGKSKQAESLRSEILEKSSSIFLWVVLVIDVLNSEYPNSSVSIKKIRERLKEIPPRLNDLFDMILTRDGEDLEQLRVCLKWILFTARPLKPQELYFAIQLGVDKESSGCWDQEDVELAHIQTFVRSSSKGLAEVTRNETSEVQFIHESVRDFLLGKYEGEWSGVSDNLVGHSHELLKSCCLAQLNASISQDVDIPDPLPPASETAQLRKTISLKFPFLEYSILNVLHHANVTHQNAIGQEDFLDKFPLQRWIFLNNSLERIDVQRYTESASLLYILAERNLADLIRIHPKKESCFDIENELYGLPMFAALATRSDEAVRTFLEVQMGRQPLSSPLHSLWKQYCHVRHKWTSFGHDFTLSQRKNIGSYLAEHGNEVVLASYLGSGVYVDFKDEDGRTPLLWAAYSRNEAMVKMLLANKGVDVNSKDNNGRAPLWWAAYSRNKAIVKLLATIEGIDANSKDKSGRTALWWAAFSGDETVVKLLLAIEGVDVNSKDKYGQTPLWWAARNRREAIVKLLLATEGVDADSKDNNGRTALWRAVHSGNEAIVKILLANKGVDINSRDKDGRTALWYAVYSGHKAMIKLLLATEGVDVTG